MSFAHLPNLAQLPQEPQYILRSRRSLPKFLGFLAFAIFFAVVIYFDRASKATFEPLLVAGGIVAIAYYWYLVPCLQVLPQGIRIVNAFSIREIQWEIFRHIDARFGLVVVSEADVKAESAVPTSGNPASKGRVQTGKGWLQLQCLQRKRQRRDAVGAFPNRAKDFPQEREKMQLWHQDGVHQLRVDLVEVPEVVYGMRELHRKITNPQDVLQVSTPRSVISRKVQWQLVPLSICVVAAGAIVLGVAALLS